MTTIYTINQIKQGRQALLKDLKEYIVSKVGQDILMLEVENLYVDVISMNGCTNEMVVQSLKVVGDADNDIVVGGYFEGVHSEEVIDYLYLEGIMTIIKYLKDLS